MDVRSRIVAVTAARRIPVVVGVVTDREEPVVAAERDAVVDRHGLDVERGLFPGDSLHVEINLHDVHGSARGDASPHRLVEGDDDASRRRRVGRQSPAGRGRRRAEMVDGDDRRVEVDADVE
jgi:hypothetical protein